MIEDGDITGLTSNPTIFEQAIAGTDVFDDVLCTLAADGQTADSIFDALAIEDIKSAADLFMPT